MDEDVGTVLIQIPDEMPFGKIREIVKVVTDVTKVEGGRESSFTCGNDIMFFKITENESYQIRSKLVDLFGEEYVYDILHFTFDDQFDDEQDELGTVCAGCWKDIPENEKTLYSEDNTPYCEDCYLRLIVGEKKKDVTIEKWRGKTLTDCPVCRKPIHDYEMRDGVLVATCGICGKETKLTGFLESDVKMEIKVGNIIIKKAMTNIGEEAVTITNTDGEDESIMLFEYDWDCLMEALEKAKKEMGEWKKEEPKW